MFIAKNNDLIVLARNTREELEQDTKFMVVTSIEETDKEYSLYNGRYLTAEEIRALEQDRIDHLTMTALDLITAVKNMGVTDQEIETFLNSRLDVKHQLQFCQNVFCGVVKGFCPVELGKATLTSELVERLFKAKHGEV